MQLHPLNQNLLVEARHTKVVLNGLAGLCNVKLKSMGLGELEDAADASNAQVRLQLSQPEQSCYDSASKS